MEISTIGTFDMAVPATSTNKTAPNQGGFEKIWNQIEQLNTNQQVANTQIQDVLSGKSDDTHGALIALQKVELQMQMATVVRDKLTQGYQQIMNMQM